MIKEYIIYKFLYDIKKKLYAGDKNLKEIVFFYHE